MLNQIENQFEGFISSMYGKITISESQEKDIEKSFYAGMFVYKQMIEALDNDEEIALNQITKLHGQIIKKMEDLTNV